VVGENDHYQVSGEAYYGIGRPTGPNVGNLDFQTKLDGGSLRFSRPNGDRIYKIALEFSGTKMNVKEENTFGTYGANVHFAGEYE
jgi:hypothetical protein